jgi:hypothetical protein
LGIIMVLRDRGILNRVFWGGIWRIVSVSGFSMMAGYVAVSILPLGASDVGIMTLGGKFGAIAIATFLVHISISGLFGLEEVRPIFTWVKRIVMRPIRGAFNVS